MLPICYVSDVDGNLKMSSLPSNLNHSIWTSFAPEQTEIPKPCNL